MFNYLLTSALFAPSDLVWIVFHVFKITKEPSIGKKTKLKGNYQKTGKEKKEKDT